MFLIVVPLLSIPFLRHSNCRKLPLWVHIISSGFAWRRWTCTYWLAQWERLLHGWVLEVDTGIQTQDVWRSSIIDSSSFYFKVPSLPRFIFVIVEPPLQPFLTSIVVNYWCGKCRWTCTYWLASENKCCVNGRSRWTLPLVFFALRYSTSPTPSYNPAYACRT